jgi:putative glutamine amidotransferase
MHMAQPLIGITCSRMVGGAWGVYSQAHFMDYTFSDYSRAILACGGAPVLIPSAQNSQSLKALFAHLAGLILTGGPDVNPRNYNEPPSHQLGDIDAALDIMELEAARLAYAMDLPLLAICRGIQVLNVALGGSLYQDIATQIKTPINHAPNMDKGTHSHQVTISEDTRLEAIMQTSKIWVNSKHHQAVKDPAPSLRPVAHADDGIIEALENPAKRFVVGVQWHPEGMWDNDAYARRLFAALIDATDDESFEITS